MSFPPQSIRSMSARAPDDLMSIPQENSRETVQTPECVQSGRFTSASYLDHQARHRCIVSGNTPPILPGEYSHLSIDDPFRFAGRGSEPAEGKTQDLSCMYTDTDEENSHEPPEHLFDHGDENSRCDSNDCNRQQQTGYNLSSPPKQEPLGQYGIVRGRHPSPLMDRPSAELNEDLQRKVRDLEDTIRNRDGKLEGLEDTLRQKDQRVAELESRLTQGASLDRGCQSWQEGADGSCGTLYGMCEGSSQASLAASLSGPTPLLPSMAHPKTGSLQMPCPEEDFKAMSLENTTLKRAVTDYQNKIKQLKALLVITEEERSDLHSAKANHDKEREELRSKLADKVDRLTHLEDQLSQYTAELYHARDELSKVTIEKENVLSENTKLRRSVFSFEKTISLLEDDKKSAEMAKQRSLEQKHYIEETASEHLAKLVSLKQQLKMKEGESKRDMSDEAGKNQLVYDELKAVKRDLEDKELLCLQQDQELKKYKEELEASLKRLALQQDDRRKPGGLKLPGFRKN